MGWKIMLLLNWLGQLRQDTPDTVFRLQRSGLLVLGMNTTVRCNLYNLLI